MRAKTSAFFAGSHSWCIHWAQAAFKPVYIESFRKGPTRISAHNLVANLDSQNPYYQATMKDFEGNDRYQLSLEPQRVGEGDERVLSWQVQLIDPHRGYYLGKLLVATKTPELLSDRPQDRAWWLDPSPCAVVPLLATRVQGRRRLRCSPVQVKEYQGLVPAGPSLDSMRVELQFSGTEPQHD